LHLFAQAKLPPGANRILFVKNLNYQITGEDLYDLFGRYGSIRQIRIGNEPKTKGTAFVVFDDVMDVRSRLFSLPPPLIFDFHDKAKNALEHLNGFHLQERYIVVLYHMPAKQDAAAAKAELARREEELAQLKQKHNINDDD
jgi:pre-mRNA branch site protein p14